MSPPHGEDVLLGDSMCDVIGASDAHKLCISYFTHVQCLFLYNKVSGSWVDFLMFKILHLQG